MRSEPFAIQIYRRFLRGETIDGLALEFGIPVDRIETRIRAAAIYRESHPAEACRRAA
ncbi:MAG TPA: hypothetical protein VN442_03295 [Bryobacteraceae bacterium]|nr:hypothetical protein [Bryobacteraceae bacterium]